MARSRGTMTRTGAMLGGLALLGVGAIGSQVIQSNPAIPGAKPGTGQATPAAPVPGTPAVAGVASIGQSTAKFKFDDKQKDQELDLQPDQTVTIPVGVVLEKEPERNFDCEAATYCDAVKKKAEDCNAKVTAAKEKAAKAKLSKECEASKNQADKDCNATKVKTATEKAAMEKAAIEKAAKDKCVKGDGLAGVEPKKNEPLPKFYLDLTSTTKKFRQCPATVTPMTANISWTPGTSREIPISITSCSPEGGKGELGIIGSAGKTLHVTLKPRNSWYLVEAMIGSLGLAVLICIICALTVSTQGHKLTDRMGQASWDFSTSWASNITAFGAAFIFLLSLSAFPDKPFFAPRSEYTLVAAFATALVALAPAIHRLASVAAVKDTKGEPEATPAGLVGGFLTASAFTIWGALLQFALELLIVLELRQTMTIYPPIGLMVEIAIGITAVGLVVYCWTTILATVAAGASRTGQKPAKRLATFSGNALDEEAAITKPVFVL